ARSCVPSRRARGRTVGWRCSAPLRRSVPGSSATAAAAAPASSRGSRRTAIVVPWRQAAASNACSKFARSPLDRARRSGGDLLEAVAKPAHGGDANRPLLDLLAQAVNVDLDRVVADLVTPFAQALHQLILADQPACPLQQHLQQRQLARGQLDQLIVDVGDTAAGIKGQRTMPDDAGGRTQPAPR